MAESSLKNKYLIITGGTQGLGKAIALLAAKKGASGIIICGRNEENGKLAEKEIKAEGSECFYIKADLSKVDDCRSVVKFCDEKFGRVDGLVNAAGLTTRGTLEDTTEETYDIVFNVNTKGPFFLMQDSVKLMKREKTKGSIVNIISISAHGGQSFISPYCAAKGALAILSKNAAHALKWDKIRVNGINMGWTYTDNEQKTQEAMGQPANWLEDAEKNLPFGRLLYPNDIAKLTMYLLSDDSEMMTGSIIDLDQQVVGGMD